MFRGKETYLFQPKEGLISKLKHPVLGYFAFFVMRTIREPIPEPKCYLLVMSFLFAWPSPALVELISFSVRARNSSVLHSAKAL